MAMAVVYANFGGQIVHENRGGVERRYIADTLGSTIALTDSGTAITDTWDYWPYGEVMSRTGTNPTPFTFVGVLGYFKDVLDKLFYVSARHYQPNYGRWLTVDPLWPGTFPYAYCGAQPNAAADPMGLLPPIIQLAKQCGLGLIQSIGNLVSAIRRGQRLDWKELLCNLAPNCLAAVLAFLLIVMFPQLGILASCAVTGIVAGLINAGVAVLCGPPDPCSASISLACSIYAGIMNGLVGCISGVLGGGGLQLIDTILGSVLNFFVSEGSAGCPRQFVEGSDVLPDMAMPIS